MSSLIEDAGEMRGSMPSAPVYDVPPITDRERIVRYALEHPTATASEIARALGTRRNTTSATLSRWRNGHLKSLPPYVSEPEFIECDLRCVCLFRQTESLPGDRSVKAVLAQVTCRGCGRLGAMLLVPSLEHPPSIDANDID